VAFYFAWADANETTFSETDHAIEDEDIFSFHIAHAEGEFATMELEIRNPRVGLLSSGRQQWGWLSWDDPDNPTSIVPLFFGRLVGVPQNLEQEIVRLFFIARPTDYEDQKETVADALRVLPYYDPVWFSQGERADPDAVLEGYTRLWHIDRVTHTVTTSDIATGEAGTIDIDETEALYDGLQITHGESPARRCIVEASVNWAQAGSGSIDLTQRLKQAFAAVTPGGVPRPQGGQDMDTGNMIVLIGGESMVQAWPTTGAAIGGGWQVGHSAIGPIGPKPQPVILAGQDVIADFAQEPGLGIPISAASSAGRSLGSNYFLQGIPFGFPEEMAWIPAWRLAAELEADWSVNRNRTETASFTLDADVQPLLTDAGEEEVVRLNLGPVTVDDQIEGSAAPIGDPLRASYFKTDRGISSFEHAILRARALLIARARAVDVSAVIPFGRATTLSCRHNVALSGDDRIPGGVAVGKVKSYSFSCDGRTGALIGGVTIGCTVGRGGTVSEVAGTPTYAEAAYQEQGYEVWTGGTWEVGSASDVGYTDFQDAVIDDDGVNFQAINVNWALVSLGITGGFITEQEEVETRTLSWQTAQQVVDVLTGVQTTVTIQLRPVTGGPFNTTITPTLTDLVIPNTLDLETT
jgi:hypothetical protein